MPCAAERLDAREDRVAALRVDADRRLVEHQQPRPVEQPDADVEPALHAAASTGRPVAGPLVEADDLEHLADAPLELARRPARTAARRSAGSRARSGPGRSRAPGARSRWPPWPPPSPTSIGRAGDRDLAAVALEQAADHRDRGGLAGAVRARAARTSPPARCGSRRRRPQCARRSACADPCRRAWRPSWPVRSSARW